MATLLALVFLSSPAVFAKEEVVLEQGEARAKLTQRFGGIVKRATRPGVWHGPTGIVATKDLEALWKRWKLGKVPKVDFKTQVVTISTWSGSRMVMNRQLDKKGHLVVSCAGGTKDLVDGLTYAIEIYTVSGVKSVNGVKVPRPKKN